MGKFTFVKGNHFYNPENVTTPLEEGFIEGDGRLDAQVSAEHIRTVMENYLALNQKADIFFFMEVPLNLDQEKVEKKPEGNNLGILKSQHRMVYYLDGIDSEEGMEILDTFGEVLINDGLSAFGFGTKDSEIGKYQYNEMLVHVYEDMDPWKKVFLLADVPERKDLTFADDVFSWKNPGVAERYEDDQGRSVYDVVDVLKKAGLYEAEVREENPDDGDSSPEDDPPDKEQMEAFIKKLMDK